MHAQKSHQPRSSAAASPPPARTQVHLDPRARRLPSAWRGKREQGRQRVQQQQQQQQSVIHHHVILAVVLANCFGGLQVHRSGAATPCGATLLSRPSAVEVRT